MSTINYQGVDVSLIGDIDLALLSDQSPRESTWLTDTFFSRELVTTDKTLAIGSLNMTSPIAPYVNPCVEGRFIRDNRQATVKYIDFAYLKPKTIIEPCSVYDSAIMAQLRAGNKRISTSLSQQEAFQLDQVQKLDMLRKSIDNRVNLMCAEVFTTGKLIVMSDDQPKFEVDFGRDASANFAPALTWDLPNSTPVQDIETMMQIMFELTGSYGANLVMRTSVWKALVKHNDFNDVFIKPYGGIRNVLENTTFNTSVNQANLKIKLDNGLTIWTFDGYYTDEAGNKQFYLPDGYCGVVDNGSGVRAYGAIQDLEANLGAFKYFPKTWLNRDPSALYMLVQSAPMVVPADANQVVGGNGFVA